MRAAGGLRGGVLVLPRSTPLEPGCGRYFVTGTSGGHTSRIGDADRPDAHTCLTKRGTSRVRAGAEDERSLAAPALAVERSVTAPNAIAPQCAQVAVATTCASWTSVGDVRNHLLMASCEALLRSGTACRSAALTDSAFCSHHAALVEEIGEERVESGDLRAVGRHRDRTARRRGRDDSRERERPHRPGSGSPSARGGRGCFARRHLDRAPRRRSRCNEGDVGHDGLLGLWQEAARRGQDPGRSVEGRCDRASFSRGSRADLLRPKRQRVLVFLARPRRSRSSAGATCR